MTVICLIFETVNLKYLLNNKLTNDIWYLIKMKQKLLAKNTKFKGAPCNVKSDSNHFESYLFCAAGLDLEMISSR